MIGSYALDIARGAERDYTFYHVFGVRVNISGNESIWTQGGLYPWSAWDGDAKAVFVKSTAADTGSLRVVGLDANWLTQEETVTLTGTTAVELPSTFRRINAMYYSGPAVGTITARTLSGIGTVVANIPVGYTSSPSAIYTIPADYNAYGTQLTVGTGKGGDGMFRVFTRTNYYSQGTFVERAIIESYQNSFTQNYSVPVLLEAKTDIDFRIYTGSNNFNATASFDIVLDKRP